jgi:signal transduction histidine kinase
LQALSRRLVEVQENERRGIARELHDEIGQLLTGLKLILELPERLPAKEVKHRLEDARSLVSDIMGRVREISLSLRPAMLDDLGLLPALLWHFERYSEISKVKVHFHHSGLEGRRFDTETETAVYRIVQEAATNIARHAGIGEVTIRLFAGQEKLDLEVEDRGVGFDVRAALSVGTSSGLVGMRERAHLLGGRLAVESVPGRGTKVTAELPVGGPVERRTRERGT